MESSLNSNFNLEKSLEYCSSCNEPVIVDEFNDSSGR